MRKLLAVISTTLLFFPVATLANEFDDPDRVFGRSRESVIATLKQKGIEAEHVEEWGNAIRVDGRNADGSYFYVLVDQATLLPREPAASVATQLSVQTVESGWSEQDFNPPRSLVD